ncbi:MAG: hypothetical protein IH840_14360 [Candidatus Heimdallarchaeota archaeon]|nr:hypothetical protein [Candidatus Heimdallarchaeota archaeon]
MATKQLRPPINAYRMLQTNPQAFKDQPYPTYSTWQWLQVNIEERTSRLRSIMKKLQGKLLRHYYIHIYNRRFDAKQHRPVPLFCYQVHPENQLFSAVWIPRYYYYTIPKKDSPIFLAEEYLSDALMTYPDTTDLVPMFSIPWIGQGPPPILQSNSPFKLT